MSSKKKLAVLACAATAAVPAVLFGGSAIATHEPANKAAATANGVAEFDESVVLLQERIKVSSPYDLILQLTSECSILTELTTGGGGLTTDTARAEGSVRMWITLDGKTVPISTADADETTPGTQNDDGRATFCNRVYSRTVNDGENDGTDEEADYIRTKNANAFNWLALNVGSEYDNPANGNNIIDVVVHAEYDTSTQGRAVADAYVGRRSLIIEPTNASVHEQVTPTDTPEGATVIGLPTAP